MILVVASILHKASHRQESLRLFRKYEQRHFKEYLKDQGLRTVVQVKCILLTTITTMLVSMCPVSIEDLNAVDVDVSSDLNVVDQLRRSVGVSEGSHVV